MRLITGLLVLASFAVAADKDVDRRLDEAAAILSEVIDTDKGIPQDLLDHAHCAVVVPSLKKGAFVVGAQYGKGFLTCRKAGGGWSAPVAMRVEGGSVGFQIGGSETEVVMLVMNPRAVDKLLASKFTLGGEGEVAAGPVGRTATAETDLRMRAEILSWSRSRGVFAGVSLKGATLRPDDDENMDLYGKKLDAREILKAPAPVAASRFLAVLNKYSPTEKK
jgi:lipid-binding SYLF domain-containing protein